MTSQPPFRQQALDPAARLLAQAIKHHRVGRLAEAERSYRAVLNLIPRHADASHLLGILYLLDGRPQLALPLIYDAMQAQPNNPVVLNNLGAAFRNVGRADDAANCFRRALEIDPNFVDALTNHGTVLHDKGDLQGALVCYKKALEQEIDNSTSLNNLALALWQSGNADKAHELLERAVKLEPTNAEAIANLGGFMQGQGRLDEALKYYNTALTYAPTCKLALFRKGMALLAVGEYREGWKLYESGIGHHTMRSINLCAPANPWDGKPAPGKHLLIWTEQGFGDALQFIRYAALCKERVGKISVFCFQKQSLVRLFTGLPFIDHVFDVIPDGSYFDEHVPMLSLPHIFDTVLENVPATVPYLRVDREIQTKWATRFAGVNDVKVGLVWAGSSHNVHTDWRRSVGLERMKAWLDISGARFYNLQMGAPRKQIAALGLTDRLTDFMDEVEDFADTAAIVQNLDLVITVDTSVAHLAGGLGKPVWILSRYGADWRWLQNRPTNPWYPTARIFGQPILDDWDSVMTEVGRALANEIAKKSAMTTNFVLSPFRTQ